LCGLWLKCAANARIVIEVSLVLTKAVRAE
jgi:hypothetical protein